MKHIICMWHYVWITLICWPRWSVHRMWILVVVGEVVKSTNFSIIWNISSTDTELFLLFTFVIATWSWWLARVSVSVSYLVSVTQFSRQTNLRQNKLGKVGNFEFWRSKLKRKFVKLSGVKTQEVLWKYKTKERIKSSSKHRMITQTLSNCPKKIA